MTVSGNILGVGSTATFCGTGVSLGSACDTGRSCGNLTLVPCVLNCSAVFITAVYTLKGVSCIFTVTVRFDGSCVGVFLLSKYK